MVNINNEILKFTWADFYREYLKLHEKGLKKQSKIVLNDFIREFKNQNRTNRRSFVDAIFNLAFVTDRYSTFLPMNLYKEVVLPEIKEWIQEDPYNLIPLRWSDELHHVKRALQIEPTDQISLIIYANRLIGTISMNQHEINSGFSYDGNPKEDIDSIDFFEKFVPNILNIDKKERILNTLLELKKCALSFMNQRNV